MSTTAPEQTAIDSHLVVGPDDGYGDVSLVRITLPADARTGPRRHDDADRLVIVLDGHARIEVDERAAVTLGPNEVLHVPRGAWHRVEGVGAAELLVLAAQGQR